MSDKIDTKFKLEKSVVSLIFKLNVDCFEELFDWLSLTDLRALGQTCKRMQKVVDYHIKSNYPAVKKGQGRIRLNRRNCVEFQKYDPFSVKKINELELRVHRMTEKDVDNFKSLLPRIEKLHVVGEYEYKCDLEFDLYNSILKKCLKLKHLRLSSSRSKYIFDNDDNEWLLHRYPLLEHVEFYITADYKDCGEIEELTMFFELNPNIRVFAATNRFLTDNRKCFSELNVYNRFDRLDVYNHTENEGSIYALCAMLNQLYNQGFYKQIHMHCDDETLITNQRELNELTSIKGMHKLELFTNNYLIPNDRFRRFYFRHLPLMPALQELVLHNDKKFDDWEMNVRNVSNLKRITFMKTNLKAIMPFLRYASKLREIIIDNLEDDSHFENGIIDLVALNKERGKMAGALKVTIYVDESIYLATKFAKINTDLNLIRLKRAEAIKRLHPSQTLIEFMPAYQRYVTYIDWHRGGMSGCY